MPLAASRQISHATKTGRDTRGASPFGSQKTRVGDVGASAQDESNAKTPVQKFKNRRLKYENELFASMNVGKMYAWEDSFKERIDGVRTNELGLLWKAKLLQMWNSFFIKKNS